AFMPLCTEKYRSIWLAFKGVCVARVTLKQYRSQVHSGMESILRSPNLRHALDMFLTFFDKRSRKHPFPIDSLVGEVTYKDRELANQLATSMNLQQFADLWGVAVKELCSTNVVDCVLDELRSHVNILSWGSEHCEGVVPTRAYAELEFRISPSVQLTASEIEEEVRRYVQSLEPYLTEGVLLDSIEFVAGTGEPFRAADPEGPLVKTLQRSYQSFGENIPLVPALFASIPEGATIRRALGIPFLTGGLGVGHGAHVPNEYILEGAYERFKEWLVVFFHQVAR
ncbi:MAG: hypothetical protein ABIP54_04820, partial [Candidatus Andersenbacteria bacterium]